jgi:hypothetical protein
VSREDIPWVVVIALLLIGGYLIGQRFVVSESTEVSQMPEQDEGSFRRWFWEYRTLDLAVQVGLVLGGALSIAALLPRNKEDEVE